MIVDKHQCCFPKSLHYIIILGPGMISKLNLKYHIIPIAFLVSCQLIRISYTCWCNVRIDFYIFPLDWWRKSKISLVCRVWLVMRPQHPTSIGNIFVILKFVIYFSNEFSYHSDLHVYTYLNWETVLRKISTGHPLIWQLKLSLKPMDQKDDIWTLCRLRYFDWKCELMFQMIFRRNQCDTGSLQSLNLSLTDFYVVVDLGIHFCTMDSESPNTSKIESAIQLYVDGRFKYII